MEGGDRLLLPAERFGFGPETEYVKFYLDGSSRGLSKPAPAADFPVSLDTQGLPGRLSFMATFKEETQLIGYPKLLLYTGVDHGRDGDLFVWMQKLDKNGNLLSQITIPNRGAAIRDFNDDGASITRYKGSWGRLRLSMRRLDPRESTPEVPAYAFDRKDPLSPGQIVEAEIAMSPVGLIFYPGESIRLVISAKEEYGNGMMPGTPGCIPENTGRIIICTGGSRASYLQLPIHKSGAAGRADWGRP